MNKRARVRDRLQGACAGLVIIGGALIALGSQWRFTTQDDLFSTRFAGGSGRAIISPGPLPVRQVSFSSWALVTLVLCALVVISLAAEAAAARPRRGAVLWSLLFIASLQAEFVAYIGMWTSGTSLSVDSGYFLVATGCGLVAFASGLWIVALRRSHPQRRLALNPRRSLNSAI